MGVEADGQTREKQLVINSAVRPTRPSIQQAGLKKKIRKLLLVHHISDGHSENGLVKQAGGWLLCLLYNYVVKIHVRRRS